MKNMIILNFVGFLFLATVSDAICCDSIKSLMYKKIEAHATFCAKGTTLSPKCCRDIAMEVRKYVAGYKALCVNGSSGKLVYKILHYKIWCCILFQVSYVGHSQTKISEHLGISRENDHSSQLRLAYSPILTPPDTLL